MSTADEVALVNTLDGADLYARAATGTQRVVDSREIVLDSDSTVRAGLLTLHTTYTAVGAILTGESTLVLVGALNDNAGGVVDKMDNTVGALANADATADTLSGVNVCNAVFNGDRALRTHCRTVAVAEAGEGTEFVAAVRHISGTAGLVTLVVVLSLCNVAGTVAGNVSYLLNNVLCFNAEDLCDSLSSAVTAGNTEVGLVGGLFTESLSIAVTARVAARTAVCTGEAVTDSKDGLVLLNAEEHACEGKECRTCYGNTEKNKNGNKNCHIITPFLREKTFHNSCEAEERKSNDGSRYECDGNTLERLG